MVRRKNTFMMAASGAVLVIWLALRIAPYTSGGLFNVLNNLGAALSGNPFQFNIVAETGKTVLFMTAAYLLAVVYFYANMKNKRPGEEYGSAKWGDVRELQKIYGQNPFCKHAYRHGYV